MPESEGNITNTIQLVLGVVARRRWWILSTACIVPIITIAVALKLPDHFVSEATLLIVQQQVSQRYVEPDSTSNIAAAIQALKLEVLSSNRLFGIIGDLNLYATETEHSASDLLVERMRKDIEITPLEIIPGRGDFNAFTISFNAKTPRLAQEVTSRLTSLFIEQNLKTHGEQAENTTKFLSDQLDTAKQRLTEQEQRVQAFKIRNLGQLPEQQATNTAAMTELRVQLGTLAASLSQAKQQQTAIEFSLTDRLTRLQSEKSDLMTRYTPKYPGVLKKDREIARVQSVLEALRAGSSRARRTEEADLPDDPAVLAVVRQAEANTAEVEALTEQQQRLKAESERYQTQLNLAPVREQQLADIQRDYDLYKQDYRDLLNKKLQSQLTASLEENQQGQQFRLVEPPSLPLNPAGPKRLKIALGGMAGGIALGLALAFLLDMLDGSFHNEKVLGRSFSLPLVVGVPFMQTAREIRRRRWRIAFECLAGSVMTLAMFAAEFYVYKKG
jgi:polysaccharide chain length determinant protein (PEP-CTERM system associated)